MQIHQFLSREDNFGVLIRCEKTGATAAIDAPDAEAVHAALAQTGWALSHILVTHKHFDHIEGVPALKSAFGCQVIAPKKAAADVPGADLLVGEGDRIMVGALAADVIETPGHCADHICYLFGDAKVAFVGDVLFALGCGRVFDEAYPQMWASLCRLAALPDETAIYCGHEYTLSNAKFAVHVEPENEALRARQAEIIQLRAENKPTLPTMIGLEKATNPFLRAGSFERFKELRELKNRF